MRIISQLKSFIRKILRTILPRNKKIIKTSYKSQNNRSIQTSRNRGGISRRHQSHVHVNSINRTILNMVNRERRKRHLPPVVYDQSFEHHAVRWSKHMAYKRSLSHSGTILENVCMVSVKGSPRTITKDMFYCWKKSRPHWNWMMNPQINRAGFSYTIRGKYAYGAYAFNDPE